MHVTGGDGASQGGSRRLPGPGEPHEPFPRLEWRDPVRLLNAINRGPGSQLMPFGRHATRSRSRWAGCPSCGQHQLRHSCFISVHLHAHATSSRPHRGSDLCLPSVPVTSAPEGLASWLPSPPWTSHLAFSSLVPSHLLEHFLCLKFPKDSPAHRIGPRLEEEEEWLPGGRSQESWRVRLLGNFLETINPVARDPCLLPELRRKE